jgi:hypothetical protein
MGNEGKTVGADKAFREAEKQVREMDKEVAPKTKEPDVDKSLFERNREALERAQKDGKVGK